MCVCVHMYVAVDAHWQAFMILSLPGPCCYTVFGTALQKTLVAVLLEKPSDIFSLTIVMNS